MDFYKIYVLDNKGDVIKILVFSGNAIEDINNPNIFSDEEREFMKIKEITPNFIKSQIHKDDSIYVIKKKIIACFENICYDEIYLFSKIKKEQSIESIEYIYNSIYKKGKDYLDRETFSQILKNLNVLEEDEEIEKKTEYSLEDLKTILSREIFTTKISLGINFASMKDESFSFDPLDILPNFLYEGTSENALLSFENRLLMNFSDKLLNNIIFLSFASDIFDFLEKNENNIQKTIQLYYPLLAKREIYDKSTFLKKQSKLVKETKKIMDKKSNQLYENIDLLYDVFYTKKDDLPYLENGIKSLQICIHPQEIQLLPLDSIFKNIHSTKKNPFIKYNPGSRRENIYRLFSTKLNKYGSKIPFLSRTKILQLSRNIGKSKQISFYIPYLDIDKTIDILLTITQNSNIYIDCDFEYAKLYKEINTIFADNINPIIQNINNFLSQTGYELQIIENIKNNLVEIVKMKYFCKVPGNIKILNDGYISSVFDVIEENVAKGAILKYKRVENYEEMNAETSLIMDWFMENGRNNREEIITLLMDFSSIERDEALLKINSFLGNHTIIKGKYVNSNEDILENAGFLTKIGLQYDDASVYVEIDNINSIDYIKCIQIYIDSILRLKIFSDTIEIDKSRILNATKQITNVKNIKKSHIENIVEVTKAKPLTFTLQNDEEDEEGLVFIDEDEDEDENQDEEKSENSNFIENLDDYEDAILEEIETIDPEIPNISIKIGNDIDEPKDESEDEGLVFDYDNEDQDDDEDQDETTGGDGEELDGLLLREKNNNIFLKRLKKKDPTLYLTADVGKQYARYSRLCQSNRQPVVISDAEKQKIDMNYEGSYTNALQYGTDPKNKSWYICPRFWCLKTNTSITEEQVKSGMCGKIIPQHAKIVPPGHYVYEFDREKHESPGFLTSDNLHPDGYCLPCCFKNWDSKLQKNARKKCMERSITTINTKIPSGKNLSILKIEAVPIDQYRYGFLPMNVQRFLQIDYSKVLEKDNPTLLNGETLLRYGVPQNKNKSFIGCISDIYSKKKRLKQTLSIKQMCNIIMDSISIDLFIKVHNGTLPAVFRTNKIDDSRYLYYLESQESQFIKSLNILNKSQKRFLDETIASYENFLDFLRNEKSIIDYTYLWDIICTPNPKLFEVGVNLAILDVTENDNTDNIELICPSSAYSKMYYDPKKETILLLKNNEIYEPIYMVSPSMETPTFFESIIQSDLKEILRIIRKTSQNYCAPISSIRKYEFKRNKMGEEVRLNLIKYKYSILYQIQNSQGKIIGFQIMYKENKLMIPCLPSSVLSDIPIKYIEDDDLWIDYISTRDSLESIYQESQGNIYCNPVMKMIEDGLIIGILTETNQFIQIDPPSENIHDDGLKELNGTNYLIADKNISSRIEDYKRIKTVKMISLESQFYSSFRSLVRILINDYQNKEQKKQIMKYIENKDSKYTSKYRLKSIEFIIRKICSGHVQFFNYSEEVLMSLNEITNCQDPSSKKYCISRDSTNILRCPKKHLISGAHNQIIYFGRVADELIRYKRIQSFMLEPKTFLNISRVNYNILENEMILLESLLTKNYFEDLIPRNLSSSLNITYDMAHPKISQKYSNKINLIEQEKSLEEKQKDNEFDILCIKEITDVVGNIGTNIWKKRFPSNVKEIFFNETRECSFYAIVYILRELYKTEFTISQIKETLRNAYLRLLPMFEEKIIKILKKQGKEEMMNSIEKKRYTLEEIIISEGYYLTNLDIWVLADSLNLPIILFTSNKLKNLIDSTNWLLIGGKLENKFYFLRAYTEPLPSNKFTDYHIIKPSLNLNEIKGFYEMVNNGLKGDSEYSKNVQKLKDYLAS
jgi:hypothetical protein